MALLQDPLKALEQAEWYLDNAKLEQFPGAFELAAGNLCRQTLEQALFILCFYSGMPRTKYIRPDRSLKTAGKLIGQLDGSEPATGKTYWEVCRGHRVRIARIARREVNLRRWAKDLNEPSHFALKFRKLRSDSYRSFVRFARGVFDASHRLLIIAAVNEIFSRGQMWVQFDGKDTPVLYRREVVRMKNFYRDESGKLAVATPKRPFLVIPDDEVPRGRWPRSLVIPRACVGIGIGLRMVTPKGDPIDISTFKTIIESFSTSPKQRLALQRRFKQLGLKLTYFKRDNTS